MELNLEKWKDPDPPQGSGSDDVTPGCLQSLAVGVALSCLILSLPVLALFAIMQ